MEAPPTRSRLAAVLLRTQPDGRLVGLAREGHDVAVEEIVRRYRPALVAFAAGIVPAHRAEDVVQEALTKALQALRGSSAEIALRPWLYTIVRNGALNDLRDERGHEPLDENIDGVPQPHEIAVRRGELAATVAAIKALPVAQRQALVQRELEGRSHDEIAASLGASTGAVRQLIFRARTSLRGAAGVIVPTPALRYLLAGGSAGTGAFAAGGGGGIALKAGAALIVGALVVGSGVGLHAGQDGRSGTATAATNDPPPEAGHARAANNSRPATPADDTSGGEGQSSMGSDAGGGSDANSGSDSSSSGSGSSGTVQPSSGRSGSSGDDVSGGSGGGHGEPEPGDDQGGSGGSGDDGGGSGGSGSGDDSGTSGSGGDGGTSGDSSDDSSTSGDSSDDSSGSDDSPSGDEITTESDPTGD